ncbi:MAG: HAD-IA family hydrolase [Gemmatimonadales bacterium]|nr:HAD-IA family hydrolase [Gemmatimonadales bacterium]MDQ3428205.1 HAD-IA family hydrolase [Gemmatimonadota bacterium]
MKRFECSAVVFDLDGVLVDSAAYVEQQWRRWAAAKGLDPEPFLRVCHGRRALETIRLAAPHLDAEAELAAFVPTVEAGAEAAIGPLSGAARLLESLPAGSWGVATSGTRSVATARLRRAGLPVPAVLVGAEDVVRGKPSPDAYLLAATMLALEPSDCLVVEDAPAGVEAARSAGMPVIGVTTTHQPAQLPTDTCAASLAGVHLGRVSRDAAGRQRLEILVVEI